MTAEVRTPGTSADDTAAELAAERDPSEEVGAKRTPRHEPMVMVKELCIDCAVCREVCPYTAVFFVPTQWKIALQVDQTRCTGCGGPEHAPCVQFCPSPGALVPASQLLAV